MAWITPKTDWKMHPVDALGRYNGDWFNVSDYARIKGNLEYLAERISAIFNVVTLNNMPTQTTNSTAIFASLNAIERNIDIIKLSLPFPPPLPATKTWYGNGSAPTVADLNRIESCCLTLYVSLQQQSAASIIWRIPFQMGGRVF